MPPRGRGARSQPGRIAHTQSTRLGQPGPPKLTGARRQGAGKQGLCALDATRSRAAGGFERCRNESFDRLKAYVQDLVSTYMSCRTVKRPVTFDVFQNAIEI